MCTRETCARNCSDIKIDNLKNCGAVKSPDTDNRIIQQELAMWLYSLLRYRDRRFVQETTAQEITITIDKIFRNECSKKSLTSRNCTTWRKFRFMVLPKEKIQAADRLDRFTTIANISDCKTADFLILYIELKHLQLFSESMRLKGATMRLQAARTTSK